jgi:hypothetical protein
MVTTAANSSRKTGLRPRENPRNSAAIPAVFAAGALGFTGELAADLFGLES